VRTGHLRRPQCTRPLGRSARGGGLRPAPRRQHAMAPGLHRTTYQRTNYRHKSTVEVLRTESPKGGGGRRVPTFERLAPKPVRPLSQRGSLRGSQVDARWGRPRTCNEDTCRPWPAGVLRPRDLVKLAPSDPVVASRCPTPRPPSSQGGWAAEGRLAFSPSGLQEPPPADLGAGSGPLREVALNLGRGKQELGRLFEELECEGASRDSVQIHPQMERLNRVCDFIYQGGELPDGLELRRTFHVAGSFAAEVHKFVGSFLVTKHGSGPPRPKRAVWAIRGSCGGQVALQRLSAMGAGDDADMRKLGVADASSPGGFSADPVAVQRLCLMVLPETLLCWATKVLTHDVPVCLRKTEHALAHVRREKERLREEARLRAEWEQKEAWRNAWRKRRGPLVRELWAALWNSHCGRAKSVFFAMQRIGIMPKDKIFHLVTVSNQGGPEFDEHYVALEPAGAIAQEADATTEDAGGGGIRKHAAATALEAYECMRADDKAPPPHAELHQWLQEECGAPSRTDWSMQRFQGCRGRQMMINQLFEQHVLVDLVKEGLEVAIPGEMIDEDGEPSVWHSEGGDAAWEIQVGGDGEASAATPTSPTSPTSPSSRRTALPASPSSAAEQETPDVATEPAADAAAAVAPGLEEPLGPELCRRRRLDSMAEVRALDEAMRAENESLVSSSEAGDDERRELEDALSVTDEAHDEVE